MTKDEWKQAEEALGNFFSTVKLKADGYDLTFTLKQISTYKNAITVYVNGVFQYNWLAKDCEERRRFCQRTKRSLLSAKEKADFKKLTRKMQKELAEKHNGLCYEMYLPYWTSFSALKKHLLANNQQIDLVSIE